MRIALAVMPATRPLAAVALPAVLAVQPQNVTEMFASERQRAGLPVRAS